MDDLKGEGSGRGEIRAVGFTLRDTVVVLRRTIWREGKLERERQVLYVTLWGAIVERWTI